MRIMGNSLLHKFSFWFVERMLLVGLLLLPIVLICSLELQYVKDENNYVFPEEMVCKVFNSVSLENDLRTWSAIWCLNRKWYEGKREKGEVLYKKLHWFFLDYDEKMPEELSTHGTLSLYLSCNFVKDNGSKSLILPYCNLFSKAEHLVLNGGSRKISSLSDFIDHKQLWKNRKVTSIELRKFDFHEVINSGVSERFSNLSELIFSHVSDEIFGKNAIDYEQFINHISQLKISKFLMHKEGGPRDDAKKQGVRFEYVRDKKDIGKSIYGIMKNCFLYLIKYKSLPKALMPFMYPYVISKIVKLFPKRPDLSFDQSSFVFFQGFFTITAREFIREQFGHAQWQNYRIFVIYDAKSLEHEKCAQLLHEKDGYNKKMIVCKTSLDFLKLYDADVFADLDELVIMQNEYEADGRHEILPLDLFTHARLKIKIMTNFWKTENCPQISIDPDKRYNNVQLFFFNDPRYLTLKKGLFPEAWIVYKGDDLIAESSSAVNLRGFFLFNGLEGKKKCHLNRDRFEKAFLQTLRIMLEQFLTDTAKKSIFWSLHELLFHHGTYQLMNVSSVSLSTFYFLRGDDKPWGFDPSDVTINFYFFCQEMWEGLIEKHPQEALYVLRRLQDMKKTLLSFDEKKQYSFIDVEGNWKRTWNEFMQAFHQIEGLLGPDLILQDEDTTHINVVKNLLISSGSKQKTITLAQCVRGKIIQFFVLSIFVLALGYIFSRMRLVHD